jgi:4-amino-4-deoxy-L-arabinose transferase-like glycosyltransferase
MAHAAAAFGFFIGLSLLLGLTLVHTPRPESDALRYIDYAINLHDHGVFSARREALSEPPQPGSVHVPLYPAWVALFMRLDPGIRSALACAHDQKVAPAACPPKFKLLVAAQLVLAGVFFGAVWLLALRLSGSVALAWTAAGFALLATSPLQYANRVLTEAILLPLLALFLVFLVIAYQQRQARWMLAAGVLLGLAALTRPAYAWLFFAVAGVLAAGALIKRERPIFAAVLVFALAYGATVAPWLARNKLQFDQLTLTSTHAGDILSQRVAYNRMGWDEFAVAWLYWFPDFGDHIVKRLFPRRIFEKLGWNEGSYYATVAPTVYAQAAAETRNPDAVLPYLLQTEILANPVKHALVTLPLAWRAVFVSKYWGIAGLICFCVVLVRHLRMREYAFLVASLPVWFMVFFHAFVSVSIPRYNLALIPLYAYALAFCAQAMAGRIAARWKARAENQVAAH